MKCCAGRNASIDKVPYPVRNLGLIVAEERKLSKRSTLI